MRPISEATKKQAESCKSLPILTVSQASYVLGLHGRKNILPFLRTHLHAIPSGNRFFFNTEETVKFLDSGKDILRDFINEQNVSRKKTRTSTNAHSRLAEEIAVNQGMLKELLEKMDLVLAKVNHVLAQH